MSKQKLSQMCPGANPLNYDGSKLPTSLEDFDKADSSEASNGPALASSIWNENQDPLVRLCSPMKARQSDVSCCAGTNTGVTLVPRPSHPQSPGIVANTAPKRGLLDVSTTPMFTEDDQIENDAHRSNIHDHMHAQQALLELTPLSPQCGTLLSPMIADTSCLLPPLSLAMPNGDIDDLCNEGDALCQSFDHTDNLPMPHTYPARDNTDTDINTASGTVQCPARGNTDTHIDTDAEASQCPARVRCDTATGNIARFGVGALTERVSCVSQTMEDITNGHTDNTRDRSAAESHVLPSLTNIANISGGDTPSGGDTIDQNTNVEIASPSRAMPAPAPLPNSSHTMALLMQLLSHPTLGPSVKALLCDQQYECGTGGTMQPNACLPGHAGVDIGSIINAIRSEQAQRYLLSRSLSMSGNGANSCTGMYMPQCVNTHHHETMIGANAGTPTSNLQHAHDHNHTNMETENFCNDSPKAKSPSATNTGFTAKRLHDDRRSQQRNMCIESETSDTCSKLVNPEGFALPPRVTTPESRSKAAAAPGVATSDSCSKGAAAPEVTTPDNRSKAAAAEVAHGGRPKADAPGVVTAHGGSSKTIAAPGVKKNRKRKPKKAIASEGTKVSAGDCLSMRIELRNKHAQIWQTQWGKLRDIRAAAFRHQRNRCQV